MKTYRVPDVPLIEADLGAGFGEWPGGDAGEIGVGGHVCFAAREVD